MTLGTIIKAYREEYNLSMDTFSKKSGMSKSYISLLEKNKHPKTGKPIAPSIQSIKQAADGMNMDFNDLFSLLVCDAQNIENDQLSQKLLSYYSVMSKFSEKKRERIFSIIDDLINLE